MRKPIGLILRGMPKGMPFLIELAEKMCPKKVYESIFFAYFCASKKERCRSGRSGRTRNAVNG